MFSTTDPIAELLAWNAPSMNSGDYDEKLAEFLGDLACGEEASPALALGLVRRTLLWAEVAFENDRLLYQRLVQRLTPDDTVSCPPAAKLPEDVRARLNEVGGRSNPAKPGSAKPSTRRQ